MEIKFSDGERSYTLSVDSGEPMMLYNDVGEGMSCSSKQMFDLLDEYFKREF